MNTQKTYNRLFIDCKNQYAFEELYCRGRAGEKRKTEVSAEEFKGRKEYMFLQTLFGVENRLLWHCHFTHFMCLLHNFGLVKIERSLNNRFFLGNFDSFLGLFRFSKLLLDKTQRIYSKANRIKDSQENVSHIGRKNSDEKH